jgi:hypothetical protein
MIVAAAVISGLVMANWVDVLTKSGELSRWPQAALPPDALVVAAAGATIPLAQAETQASCA